MTIDQNEPPGQVWNSITNIVLFLLVIQMPILVWFGKVDGTIFVSSVSLVFGYFFHKRGVEEGGNAAIKSAQANSSSALDTLKESKVGSVDPTVNNK